MKTAIERISDVLVIVAVIGFGAFYTSKYFHGRTHDSRAHVDLIGTKLILEEAPPPESSLVLALSTSCPFCERNVDFYRTLSILAAENSIRLVAVFPQPQEIAAAYMAERAIEVDEVLSRGLDEIGIRGTPTLLHLDASGTVKSAWTGALSSSSQAGVLKEIFSVEPPATPDGTGP